MVLSLVFFTDAVAAAQKPTIFGIWIGIDRNSPNFGKWKNKPNTPPPEFTAWGAEQSREQGRLGVELPTPGACEPINPVQFVGGGLFPNQILNGGNQIVLLNEWVAVPRRIYTDGRKHPPAEDLLPTWEGHSIGRWDGDVLVVTTKWQNGQSWLDRAGNYASNQLTVTERFTLRGPNHLWYEATLDDPATYTRPWTIEMPLYRLVDRPEQLLEHKCVTFADRLLYQDLLQNQGKE
jgi:hypothetical protein